MRGYARVCAENALVLREKFMSIVSRRNSHSLSVPFLAGFRQASLRTRLLVILVPLIALVLAVTGIVSYLVTYDYVTIALRRNAMVHNLATAEALRNVLEESRKDVSIVAQQGLARDGMRDYLSRKAEAGGGRYLAAGMVRKDGGCTLMMSTAKGGFVDIPEAEAEDMKPSPHSILQRVRHLPDGHVWLSEVMTMRFTDPESPDMTGRLEIPAVMLAAVSDVAGERLVYFVVLDARILRNVLSLYGSEKSPIRAFVRTQEVRYSYLFNMSGWILFQSESVDTPDVPLSTYLARSSKVGTLGLPELDCAFRPEADDRFWHMLGEVRQGRQGVLEDLRPPYLTETMKEIATAYAPVSFRPAPDAAPYIWGGIAYYDVSRLTVAAGYKHIDIMFIVVIAACVLATLLIYFVSGMLTRSLRGITRAAEAMHDTGDLGPINVAAQGYEARMLEKAINSMLKRMRAQLDEIQRKDNAIRAVGMKEAVPLETFFIRPSELAERVPQIIGGGATLDALRRNILKAAQVDVDVLIVGETGTGKQLTAEAIHCNSVRAEYPFISINCGELDENLLIDTLFGHVKGAFTEARNDRPGAFREADGGTLFLDEIQLASPKVQQSLLRALAMRVIKPLGSDREVPVNVRVIAATNVDLRALFADGRFREDLYFRLNVITIATPPLRNHPENILPIAAYYLCEAGKQAGRESLALSRGAVEKLMAYRWPGNIRELKNAIIRAAVMTNHDVIQADCLLLDGREENWTTPDADRANEGGGHEASWMTSSPSSSASANSSANASPSGVASEALSGAASAETDRQSHRPSYAESSAAREPAPEVLREPEGLNPRQQLAWRVLARKGTITRREYEEAVEGDIAPRTALYDLQDMVRRQVVERVGSGPGTVYRLKRPPSR